MSHRRLWRRPCALGLGAFTLAFALLRPSSAVAFVCTRVADSEQQETGPSLTWASRSITYTLFAPGTAHIPGELEFDIIRDSFGAWEAVRECRSPQRLNDIMFLESLVRSSTDRIGYDFVNPTKNENLVIFRDSAWQIPGQTNKVIALTTTTYKPLTGEILDADIEFNTADFPYVADATTEISGMDLGNVATHEIGHLLGLGDLKSSTEAELTMYGQGELGEVKKRTLECDDKNGIVFKYPAGAANGYCPPAVSSCGFCAPPDSLTTVPEKVEIDDGGCRASSSGAGGSLALGAALIVSLGCKRRRGMRA